VAAIASEARVTIRAVRKSFDIRSLAKAINKRRLELQRLGRTVTITPVMSRILENDEEYIPFRQRKAVRARHYRAQNPAIGSIVEIAAALDTTVGALLGERAYRVTRADRERVRDFVHYLTALFELGRDNE